MGHTTTWRCPWCKVQYASTEGSRFRLYRGHKRRKCAACVALENWYERSQQPAEKAA